MSVYAVVLAGGRSRRFGSDKLEAELDGTSLLAATIEAVAPVVDAVLLLGRDHPEGFRGGRIPVTSLPDDEPFGGPLAALAGGLPVANADPGGDLAIVVGGDMPLLVPAVLHSMLERLAGDTTIDAVLLEAPDAPRRQILPLALDVAAAAQAARAALNSGDRSLIALIGRLRTHELPATEWRALDPSGLSLADVDTPADLDRLRSGAAERERRR